MHTIQYAMSRREVWRWYWRSWAKPGGLWLFHVAIAIILAAFFTGVGLGQPLDPPRFAVVFAFSLLGCLLLLPLYPQIRFKSSTRSVTIDPEGIRTSIRNSSAFRAWKNVRTIEDNGEEIVITLMSRSAFIVPQRAFRDQLARSEFLRDALLWHSGRTA